MSDKITMEGQYTYRNGEPARVLCVDSRNQNWPVVSENPSGDIFVHKNDGTHFSVARDLIPVEPFKRGEVVLVRMSSDTPWYARVFYSLNLCRGGCETFDELNGPTEWWKECRRPEPGELEGK